MNITSTFRGRRAQSVIDYLIEKGISAVACKVKAMENRGQRQLPRNLPAYTRNLRRGDVHTEEYILQLTPEDQEIADQNQPVVPSSKFSRLTIKCSDVEIPYRNRDLEG